MIANFNASSKPTGTAKHKTTKHLVVKKIIIIL